MIHLWDMHHDGTWENRSTYTYYAELVLELAALSVEFLHHVHMLVSTDSYTITDSSVYIEGFFSRGVYFVNFTE